MYSKFWHDTLLKLGFIKPTQMYLRLQRLNKYLNVCTVDQLESLEGVNLSHYRILGTDGSEIKLKQLNKNEIYFQSALGTVKIKLSYVYPRKYILEYSNYAGTNVFTIYAEEENVNVDPQLNEELTAETIDLALYEFENYLEQNLGTLEELEEIEKLKQDFHEEQLKKLQNV